MLDYQATLDILNAVVNEYGRDHVKPECVNSYGNAPVCIAAHVLARVLSPASWALVVGRNNTDSSPSDDAAAALEAFHGANHPCTIGEGTLGEVAEDLGREWPFGRAATALLTEAQRWADRNNAWGEAVAYAQGACHGAGLA